ncbi:VirB4 family type IV secretion system protein [Breznakia pachnodae]|uniref:Uncharacterized protein n=1 Tax=Breznakia pachnodae TaxID=265178 RepID=A0ABU0E6V0_9FIRM|nr:ATP-binding protein [Breznakia pachnodae]MDQ0362535.1 hypothetical protein [Breznakia pachnodae]
MEIKKEEKTIRYYPDFVSSMLMIKGLYFYEWFFGILGLVIPFFAMGPLGLVFGLMILVAVLAVCHRQNGRENLLGQLVSFLNFALSSKMVIKKEREALEEFEVIEESDQSEVGNKKRRKKKSSKKKEPKKKVNKSQRKRKEKYMQGYFPFRSIHDNYIKMEDGRIFLFLRIQGNNLDFLNFAELDNLFKKLSKSMDRSKFKISFFIEDSVFDIKHNIGVVRKAEEKRNVLFLKRLANEIALMLQGQRKDANKKEPYLRCEITEKELRTNGIDDIRNSLKKTFKDSLNLLDTSQLELKQLLAIYGNRIFSNNIPDSEMEYEDEYETSLLTKKKKSFEEQQLPGIYEFKDMICPVTTVFQPSSAKIGSNVVKTYGVSSFIGATDDTNILSEVCSLKGVASAIYVDDLKLNKYKASLKLSVKSKNSTAVDEIDAIDRDVETASMKSNYRRIKETKQRMYYISIVFKLSAPTQEEMDELEEKFLEKCNDVDITVDPLITKQKFGWMSTNPIGDNKLAPFIKQNIPSESVANLYPFNDSSLMDKEGLPIGDITDKNLKVLFDTFEDRGSNNNILILGRSGQGKTILLWLLLMNEAIKGSFIRNIDIEGICGKFIERLGGINMNMAGNNKYVINPLHIRIPDEIQVGIVDDYVSEVTKWMSIYKSKWDDELLDLFQDYLFKTYELKGITNDSDLRNKKANEYPLFSDVYGLIQHDKDNYNPKICLGTEAQLRKMLLGMKAMVSGADAKLFNRYTYLGDEDIQNVEIINFDFKDMMNSALDRRIAQAANVFTYISQFVNGNMDRSKKIVVSMDEIHTWLKKQYMALVEIMDDYERRFRKYRSSFIKASQTIEEFNTDDEDLRAKVKTLFSQPSVKFLFHLGDIDYSITKSLLNLKNIEIDKLKEDREGKCLMRIGSVVYDLSVMMPEWFAEVKPDVKKAQAMS